MPTTVAAPAPSSVIPQGREDDYRELAAPAAIDTSDVDQWVRKYVDTQNMCTLPLPVTNRSEDRDGEISNPDGLIDTSYRSNPIVFLQHSHRIAPMAPPLGMSRTKDGQYDLKRVNDHWASGCKFSQATKFATQAFALIAEGTLNARSIGALNHDLSPYAPKAPGMAFHNGEIRPVKTRSIEHTLYELVEWSWVWIPSNREMTISLKGFLGRDRIDGSQIDYTLRDVLKSWDLSEPFVNPVQMGNHRLASTVFSKALSPPKVSEMSEQIIGVRFDSKTYGHESAKAFLQRVPELKDTELFTESLGGAQFLRSVQYPYAGEYIVKEHDGMPGVQVLFAKFGEQPPKKTEEEQAPEPAAGAPAKQPEQQPAQQPGAPEGRVEDIVADALNETVVVPDANGEAPMPTEGEQPETAENQADAGGPAGRRHIESMLRQMAKLIKLATADLDNQEPDRRDQFAGLLAKCQEVADEYGELGKTLYGGGGEQETDDEDPFAPKPTEGKPATPMEKRLLQEVFHGTKHQMSPLMVKALQSIHQMEDVNESRRLFGLTLKGLVPQLPKSTPAPVSRDEEDIESVRESLLAAARREELLLQLG